MATQYTQLLTMLKTRFEKYMNRHKEILWQDVEKRLLNNEKKLAGLLKMEESGGEPDVVMQDTKTGEYIFYDCSSESPKGRRSLCYDKAAWESRKEFKPSGTAVDMAESMDAELLTEEEYNYLQTLGEFDTKTSSWIKTSEAIRKLGGAVFADRRYNHVFFYHNGAESYYAVRGFRTKLRV